ncbi:hypothetical protein ACKKBG_A15635 [Auxenochlorella protothecoides x Auxenochlorella symbiontica]
MGPSSCVCRLGTFGPRPVALLWALLVVRHVSLAAADAATITLNFIECIDSSSEGTPTNVITCTASVTASEMPLNAYWIDYTWGDLQGEVKIGAKQLTSFITWSGPGTSIEGSAYACPFPPPSPPPPIAIVLSDAMCKQQEDELYRCQVQVASDRLLALIIVEYKVGGVDASQTYAPDDLITMSTVTVTTNSMVGSISACALTNTHAGPSPSTYIPTDTSSTLPIRRSPTFPNTSTKHPPTESSPKPIERSSTESNPFSTKHPPTESSPKPIERSSTESNPFSTEHTPAESSPKPIERSSTEPRVATRARSSSFPCGSITLVPIPVTSISIPTTSSSTPPPTFPISPPTFPIPIASFPIPAATIKITPSPATLEPFSPSRKALPASRKASPPPHKKAPPPPHKKAPPPPHKKAPPPPHKKAPPPPHKKAPPPPHKKAPPPPHKKAPPPPHKKASLPPKE